MRALSFLLPSLSSVFLIVCSAGTALAEVSKEEVKIAAIDYAPMTFYKNGSATGIGADVAREIVKRLKLKTIDALVPITHMDELSSSEVAIVAQMTRVPARETKYRWIGQLLEDKYCFVMGKGTAEVKSLEDAKKLKEVAVNSGGGTEKFLTANGFKNLDLSTGNTFIVKKLLAGRIEAWFSSRVVSAYTLKISGEDPKKWECKGDYSRALYWFAMSGKTSDELFNKVKATYDELEKEGVIKKIVSSYVDEV